MFQGRTDHWFFAGGGRSFPVKELCRRHGSPKPATTSGAARLAHERLRGQTSVGTGNREHPPEEAARRSDTGERGHARGTEKKWWALARRELLRHLAGRGLSERHERHARSYRYQPAPDLNQALRDRIVALAHRHRRYGAGMIYLKLRQAGQLVNHKRVERPYAEAGLQVRRRRRKNVPVMDRQPLGCPQMANQVWSMDFVFDRTAEWRAPSV